MVNDISMKKKKSSELFFELLPNRPNPFTEDVPPTQPGHLLALSQVFNLGLQRERLFLKLPSCLI